MKIFFVKYFASKQTECKEPHILLNYYLIHMFAVGFCLVCVFSPFTAGRYHSLVIEKESFPGDELKITAWTEDGLVMAARHK